MLNNHFALTALSPLDGRYHSQLIDLSDLFSEYALIRQRVRVEVEYLLFLAEHTLIPSFTVAEQKQLQTIVKEFALSDAEQIKELEHKTKHDVKAVEYFLRQKLTSLKLPNEEFVHLALTSEDTNSIAYSLMIRDLKDQLLIPELKNLLRKITELSLQYVSSPMLARTHGQAAVPTTVGKELSVFAYRLYQELIKLEPLQIEAKMTGAVGNFNAHMVSFEQQNWSQLSSQFIQRFDLKPNLYTTQILPTESYSEVFSSMLRINSIMLDLNQDIWRYISDGYLKQRIETAQVGSSTMPHKINPIDFENSEGNLGLANSLFTFFIQKLAVSRLQRDLSDSTVKRSVGTAFGYSFLAYFSLQKGLAKIDVDQEKLTNELNQHWEVITEGMQVILRTAGESAGYEKLKDFSRGKHLTQETIHQFIDDLEVNKTVKDKLRALTPLTYIGAAAQLTRKATQTINHYLEGEV